MDFLFQIVAQKDSTYVIRFNIENDQVKEAKILYAARAAKVLRPRINFAGTKVAFCSPTHLMVMDADGSNQRELSGIPDVTWYDNRKVTLDWPAGDWIYYRKNNTSIWRYNIQTDKDELFMEYGDSFRKWACNLTATRISIQDGMCNMLHSYPPGDFKFGANCDPGGCNVSISASGNYVNWFTGSGHSYIHLGSWDGSGGVVSMGTTRNDTMENWYGEKIGSGMDWPLWSVNSDKWMCLQVQTSGRFSKSGNQVLFNWVDSIVLPTSLNYGSTAQFYAGDLWVKPPSGKEGCYEASNGEWVKAGDAVGSRRTSEKTVVAESRIDIRRTDAGAFAITLPSGGKYAINIIDASGRSLISRQVNSAGMHIIHTQSLPTGCFMVAVKGNRSQAARVFAVNQ